MPPRKAAGPRTAAPRRTAARVVSTTKRARKSAPAAKKAARGGKRTMSRQHKAAIAAGRSDASAVRAYLEALANGNGRNGHGRPKLSKAQAKARLTALSTKMAKETDPLTRLSLAQEQVDLERLLAKPGGSGTAKSADDLSKGFVRSARRYSERKGITWSAWRRIGVPAGVLTKAGVPRTRVNGSA